MDQARSVPVGTSRPPHDGVDALLGRMIAGRYRLLAVLARGGIGAIYRAEQLPLGRQVALKVVEASAAESRDPEFQTRFAREVATASRLTHPNTVSIFEYGKCDGVYFIAMELLEGRTLFRALREDGPLPVPRALQIACQVSRSVREAHAAGLIYGDLTSANVFLLQHGDESDVVKVLDVGVMHRLERAYAKGPGEAAHLLGSPRYMAPEQICGEAVDERADIYALGVMLFEMLTGRVPFERANAVNVLMAHIHDVAPTLRSAAPQRVFAPEVEALVGCCLAKSKGARFVDVDRLLSALKRCASSAAKGDHRRDHDDFALGDVVVTPYATAPNAHALLTPSEQLPLSPPRTSGPPPRRPSRWAAMLAIGALSTAGGGLVTLAARSGARVVTAQIEATPSARAAALPVLPSASRTISAAAPKPVDTGAWALAEGLDESAAGESAAHNVAVTLRSTPPGAMVRVGSQLYGPTPVTIRWTGVDAETGREVTFRFEQPGFQDLDVTRQIRGAALTVEAPPATPLPPGAGRARRGRARRNNLLEIVRDGAEPEQIERAEQDVSGISPSPY